MNPVSSSPFVDLTVYAFCEDHVVYIFDPVTDGGKPASTTRKIDVVMPGVHDSCEMAEEYPDGTKKCKGTCAGSKLCMFTFDDDGDIVCDCKRALSSN